MAIIGNPVISAAFVVDTFSGTGSQTTFTMQVAPASTSAMIVAVSGVLKDPSTYGVNGTTLTFSQAPPVGINNISIRYLGIPASGVTTTAYRTYTEYTTTAGQTTITVASYTPGYINVHRNGVLLSTSDFTATSGVTVVLNSGANLNDVIQVESFYLTSIVNAIPAAPASIIGAYVANNTITATQLANNTITATQLANNTITPVQLSTQSQYTGFKNRIINGAMQIDQRNAGASGTATGYTVDRWSFTSSLSTKGTWQQNAGSVTPPVGFTNYLGFTSNSSYTLSAGDYFTFEQDIEGFNCADLGWGTANGKTITLSAWVYSSLTGTFSGALRNSANNRSYVFTYTISSANTWTSISVTIVGDTTGTWLTNNGSGIKLFFSFGMGTTFSTTAGSWQSGSYAGLSSAVSVVGTSSATFYITGVQLEVGSSATSFDVRDYGREFILCQRYFESTYEIGTAPGTASQTANAIVMYAPSNSATVSQNSSWYYRVTKRTSPTVTLYNPSTGATGTFRNITQSTNITAAQFSVSSNFTNYASQASGIAANETYCAHYTASSEL